MRFLPGRGFLPFFGHGRRISFPISDAEHARIGLSPLRQPERSGTRRTSARIWASNTAKENGFVTESSAPESSPLTMSGTESRAVGEKRGGFGQRRREISSRKGRGMEKRSHCAGRPFRRSEAGRKSRPAPFEMTEGEGRGRIEIKLRRAFSAGDRNGSRE